LRIKRHWVAHYKRTMGVREDPLVVWRRQTVYLAGISQQHSSIRAIRAMLRNLNAAAVIAVSIRYRPHKPSWALISLSTEQEARHMLKAYKHVGLPEEWTISQFLPDKVVPGDFEGQQTVKANEDHGQNYLDRQMERERRKRRKESKERQSLERQRTLTASHSSPELSPDSSEETSPSPSPKAIQWQDSIPRNELAEPEPEPPEPSAVVSMVVTVSRRHYRRQQTERGETAATAAAGEPEAEPHMAADAAAAAAAAKETMRVAKAAKEAAAARASAADRATAFKAAEDAAAAAAVKATADLAAELAAIADAEPSPAPASSGLVHPRLASVTRGGSLPPLRVVTPATPARASTEAATVAQAAMREHSEDANVQAAAKRLNDLLQAMGTSPDPT
jgi:hypothetical protein